MAINEITGDKLQTKVSTENYRSNYDTIFRKKVTIEGNTDEKTSTSSSSEPKPSEYASNCSEQR
jgi:hypothetical protein